MNIIREYKCIVCQKDALSVHLNRELCGKHYQLLKPIDNVWDMSQVIDKLKR